MTSGWLGYQSVLPLPQSSRITFSEVPAEPPDESFLVNLWDDRPAYVTTTETVALIEERNSRQNESVVFYCPRSPDIEGSLQLIFPIDNRRRIEQVFLRIRPACLFLFDPQAQVTVSVTPAEGNGSSILLAELSRFTNENEIEQSFEVTDYLKGAKELRITIRGRAEKLLYHPTPNDPIGFAGAQLLRQPFYESFAAKLDIWYAH